MLFDCDGETRCSTTNHAARDGKIVELKTIFEVDASRGPVIVIAANRAEKWILVPNCVETQQITSQIRCIHWPIYAPKRSHICDL